MHRRSERPSIPLRAGLLVLFAGLIAAPAAAQWPGDGPSIMTLLPNQGTVEIGGELTGELTGEDYVAEGRRVRAYSFEGSQGAPVTIDLIGDGWDSYLYLIGPDGAIVEADDDSGGACNARISTFLPQDGSYTIVAASLGSENFGAFTLRVGDRESPPASGDCGGGGFMEDDRLAELAALESSASLGLGEEVTGTLGADAARQVGGDPVAVYEVAGTPGESVVIDLMSRAFDALIYVVDPRGESYEMDDDSGGACNSRIWVTLDMQPHKIIVSSFGSGSAGEFTLKVSAEAGPRSEDDCPGLGDIDIR